MLVHQLKKHVHETFEHVRKALDLRERLLNRQIDVLVNTTPRPNAKSNAGRPLPLIDQLKFMPQNEPTVLEHIRRLGKFNVDNYKFYADPTFAIEDYICPNVDHELMYKCLLNGKGDAAVLDNVNADVVVLDLEQQIVQLTVSESKELIANSTRSIVGPGYESPGPKCSELAVQDNDNVTDEQRIAKMLIDNLTDQPSTLADLNVAGDGAGTPKSKKYKRKGAKNSNNCGGGTINLKNISSLTINTMCSRENSVKKSSKATATAPAAPAVATSSSAEPSTPTSSSTVTPPPKSTSDVIMDTHSTMENTSNTSGDGHGQSDGPIDFDCEFYNRLIADIKLTMNTSKGLAVKQQPMSPLPMTTSTSSASNTPTSSSLASPTSAFVSPMSTASSETTTHSHHECNKMLFQNIRNLNITLPSTSAAWLQSKRRTPKPTAPQTDQPVQIEEWLKQIISEPELEPSPGADFLEHSLIHEPVKAVE